MLSETHYPGEPKTMHFPSLFFLFTGAVWQRSAPMAVQLAHARGVADDDALSDAGEADDGAHHAAVPGDLGVGGHAGPVAQHHCRRQDTPEGVHGITSRQISVMGPLPYMGDGSVIKVDAENGPRLFARHTRVG